MSPFALEARTAPRKADDRSLPALIHRAAGPLVVESHFAGWETPWRALDGASWRALLLELGREVEGALVETGASRELATRYGLEVIPTVLVFMRGEVVARFTGSVEPAEIVAAVRAAQEVERTIERDERELEAASRQPASALRSVLPRRAEPELAFAG
jgi:thioredoxin-like negative regulator of GroEL